MFLKFLHAKSVAAGAFFAIVALVFCWPVGAKGAEIMLIAFVIAGGATELAIRIFWPSVPQDDQKPPPAKK